MRQTDRQTKKHKETDRNRARERDEEIWKDKG